MINGLMRLTHTQYAMISSTAKMEALCVSR